VRQFSASWSRPCCVANTARVLGSTVSPTALRIPVAKRARGPEPLPGRSASKRQTPARVAVSAQGVRPGEFSVRFAT
jgi:hypothetical protein